MTKVALCACPDYDAANVASAVDRAVTLCGGMEHFVRPRQRMLLKPNMLSAVPLEQRVPTDPAVVRAVGKLVLKAGGGGSLYVLMTSHYLILLKTNGSNLSKSMQRFGATYNPQI